MKNFLARAGSRLGLVVMSLLAALLLLEILVRLFLHPSDIAFAGDDPKFRLHMLPNQAGYNVEGVNGEVDAYYHFNSTGWNSMHDYSMTKPAGTLRIAVLGDSYPTGLQVDVDKGFPAVIEKSLQANAACDSYSQIEVYNFAYPSSSAAHAYGFMEGAAQYAPDVYVIALNRGDIGDSLLTAQTGEGRKVYILYRPDGSGGFQKVDPAPYQPDTLARFTTNSALVRYLLFNVDIRSKWIVFRRALRGGAQKAAVAEQQVVEDDEGAGAPGSADLQLEQDFANYIVAQYKKLADAQHARVVITFDADRNAIYANQPQHSRDADQARIVGQAASQAGVDFINMADPFTKDYEQNHQPLNSTVDYHWNERGHRIVGETVAGWIGSNVCQGAPQ